MTYDLSDPHKLVNQGLDISLALADEIVRLRSDLAAAREECEQAKARTNYPLSVREFIRLVAERAAQEEREACAKACETQIKNALHHYAALTYTDAMHDCVEAIRQRGAK